MKTNSTLCLLCGCLLTIVLAACTTAYQETAAVHKTPTVVRLRYYQHNIVKQFDTLYNKQQTRYPSGNDSGTTYTGLIEQALAYCHDSTGADSGTQDVMSSMYLNPAAGMYDCVTTTVFRFANGTISAMGVFQLQPGSGIAPDHDFPITGGSGAYRDIHGTYTRHYNPGDTTYYVELSYRHHQP